MSLNKRSLLGLSLAALAVALLAFPWQSQVRGPGLLTSGQFARIFTKGDGQLTAIHVRPGDSITEGQILFEMSSPQLSLEIERAASDTRKAEVSMRQALLNVRQSDQFQVFSSERDRVVRLAKDLEIRRARQTIRAPFDGTVTDVAGQLTPGRWVGDRTQLAFAVADSDPAVWAYIREGDLRRIKPGAEAWFFSDTPETAPVALTLNEVDFDSTTIIPVPGLVAGLGGSIEANETENGQFEPQSALYRAKFITRDALVNPNRLHHGTVVIRGTRESYLERAWRQLASVLVREASF